MVRHSLLIGSLECTCTSAQDGGGTTAANGERDQATMVSNSTGRRGP